MPDWPQLPPEVIEQQHEKNALEALLLDIQLRHLASGLPEGARHYLPDSANPS